MTMMANEKLKCSVPGDGSSDDYEGGIGLQQSS